MSEKTTKTKAELAKMLAAAVLNTPGARRLDEPVGDAPPEQTGKRGAAPKRAAKIKSVRASSGRKQSRR